MISQTIHRDLMIPEIDIWRSAQLIIQQYGCDAQNQAERCAYAMIEKGDNEGGAVWQRIQGAIEELQNQSPIRPVH